GIQLNEPTEIFKMTYDELEQLDSEMLSQLSDYAKGSLHAIKNIRIQLSRLPVIKIKRLFKSKKKWYFDRFGYRMMNVENNIQTPFKVVRLSTPLKKDV